MARRKPSRDVREAGQQERGKVVIKQRLRVAQIWNGTILNELVLKDPRDVTVGAGPSVDFIAPLEAQERTVLFKPAQGGGSYTLTPIQGMVGTLSLRGVEQPVAKLSGPVEVNPGDWGTLVLNEVVYFFQWVEPEALPPFVGGAATLGYALATTTVISAVLHAIIVIFAILWADPSMRSDELRLPDRFINIMAAESPDPPEELEEEEPDDTSAEAPPEDEGETGDPDEPDETILPDREDVLVDRVEVPELGMAFEQALAESGALTRMFDQNQALDLSLGMPMAMAGEGDAFAWGQGTGLGRSGSGSGGGGDGFGRVGGAGALDTGGGRGQGAGLGRRPPTRVARVDVARAGQVSGFLTREQIERVVRRHARGLRACYEVELQRDPALAGRVTVNWTIGLDGRVVAQNVAENTTTNRNMESCILREVSRMRFDQPDGGMVQVAYPFTFRSQEQ